LQKSKIRAYHGHQSNTLAALVDIQAVLTGLSCEGVEILFFQGGGLILQQFNPSVKLFLAFFQVPAFTILLLSVLSVSVV
jgi:hypothetical protein